MKKPDVYLNDEQYEFLTNSIPIICIDVIFYDKATTKIGFIKRRGSDKHALIGGRIGLGESIDAAIKRHVENDLGVTEFKYYKCSPDRPVLVHEYIKGESSPDLDKFGFDPTKQSIALTYILTTDQEFLPKNEAADYVWANKENINNIEFNFGQDKVAEKILEYINL